MAQVTGIAQTGRVGRRRLFRATDLPGLMSVPPQVDINPYRAPLLQLICDWNVAEDKSALIAKAPTYDGDDAELLAAIAVVVHAWRTVTGCGYLVGFWDIAPGPM